MEWPKKLRVRLITTTNTGGGLNINYLEMVGNLLAWIVSEVIVGNKNLCYEHVDLFSNNKAAVLWTQIRAEKSLQKQGVCL